MRRAALMGLACLARRVGRAPPGLPREPPRKDLLEALVRLTRGTAPRVVPLMNAPDAECSVFGFSSGLKGWRSRDRRAPCSPQSVLPRGPAYPQPNEGRPVGDINRLGRVHTITGKHVG